MLRLFPYLLVISVLVACAPAEITPPVSTSTAAPIASPISISASPSQSPSSETASPPLFQPAAIEILYPDDGAAISSPLSLKLRLNIPPSSPLNISLFGSDGRLLVRQLINIESPHFDHSLPFAISSDSESARLSISFIDESGRTIALSSIHLILHSNLISSEETNTSELVFPEKIAFQSPDLGQQLSTGSLEIRALLAQSPVSPVFIQLISAEGKVLHFADLYPYAVAGQDYLEISTEFDLSSAEPQTLLLSATLRDPLISGPEHIFTQYLNFSP